jgi:F0F1-type ATP synthase membrane subunit b/b'
MARKIQLRRRALALATTLLLLATAAAPAAAAEGSLEIFFDRHIIYLLALFVLLIAPVNKLLLDPLLGVLDERRERIEGARGRAEQVAKEAEAVLGRYETAVRGAKEDAETDRRSRIEGARREQAVATSAVRAEAEERMARARTEVGQMLDSARAELRTHAEELAREAASRVLGRPLS